MLHRAVIARLFTPKLRRDVSQHADQFLFHEAGCMRCLSGQCPRLRVTSLVITARCVGTPLAFAKVKPPREIFRHTHFDLDDSWSLHQPLCDSAQRIHVRRGDKLIKPDPWHRACRWSVRNEQADLIFRHHRLSNALTSFGFDCHFRFVLYNEDLLALCDAWSKDRFDAPMSLEEINNLRKEVALAIRKTVILQQINRNRIQSRYILSAVDRR